MSFEHVALGLTEEKPVVFTAMSKHLFYYRMHVCRYVLEQNYIPLNPFMVFEYFLLDTIDRDLVRNGNNVLVKRSDELWVFGDISNGVLAEIKLAKSLNMPIKYFKIEKPHRIVPASVEELSLEEDIKEFAEELK